MASKGSPLHGPRIKLIEKSHSLSTETKEHTFESKASEEHSKLLRIQHELEVATKQPIFVDSSISDTIRTCIVLGNNRATMKVKTKFKVDPELVMAEADKVEDDEELRKNSCTWLPNMSLSKKGELKGRIFGRR